jgi:hypothetical protein
LGVELDGSIGSQVERAVQIGRPVVIVSDSSRSPNRVVFEDEGETGFLYAVDASLPSEPKILDALWIHDVGSVDSSRSLSLRIRWTRSGDKVALFLDGEPQAVFDFTKHRGYSRANFPARSTWSDTSHAWDPDALTGIE